MMLTASLFAATASCGQENFPNTPEAPLKAPDDSGMRNESDSSRKVPGDPGAVVVPPTTDPESIVKPPKHVDPEIDDATKGVDRKNREKSREKPE